MASHGPGLEGGQDPAEDQLRSIFDLCDDDGDGLVAVADLRRREEMRGYDRVSTDGRMGGWGRWTPGPGGLSQVVPLPPARPMGLILRLVGGTGVRCSPFARLTCGLVPRLTLLGLCRLMWSVGCSVLA